MTAASNTTYQPLCGTTYQTRVIDQLLLLLCAAQFVVLIYFNNYLGEINHSANIQNTGCCVLLVWQTRDIAIINSAMKTMSDKNKLKNLNIGQTTLTS
jgi:hypothetical protein